MLRLTGNYEFNEPIKWIFAESMSKNEAPMLNGTNGSLRVIFGIPRRISSALCTHEKHTGG